MSDAALPARGPWWLAWLIGAAVPLLLGTLAITLWMGISAAGDDHAVAWSAGEWILAFLHTLMLGAIAALPTALLLIGLMALAERRTRKPLLLWLVLGLVATTPFAFLVWGLSNMGDCFERCDEISTLQSLTPALCFYAFGLLGTLIAYRVRHGAWFA